MTTDSKQSAQQTGADIVVKTLEQQGVKWVFGNWQRSYAQPECSLEKRP
jgi:thiamine pyrophosphate-dependent acetolactate synthase large subunit-like protein